MNALSVSVQILVLIAIGVTLYFIGPAIAVKVAVGACTGLGLATGFYLKDYLLTHTMGWKANIELNLTEGRPWYYNEAMIHTWNWRKNPVAHLQSMKEQGFSSSFDLIGEMK